MDAFEVIVSKLLAAEGYWVRLSAGPPRSATAATP